jgi:hypothetical protein
MEDDVKLLLKQAKIKHHFLPQNEYPNQQALMEEERTSVF